MCESNNNIFIVTNQGVYSITKYLNQFLEMRDEEANKTLNNNNDLYQQLRSSTLWNLGILTLNIVTSKINKILEKTILELFM